MSELALREIFSSPDSTVAENLCQLLTFEELLALKNSIVELPINCNIPVVDRDGIVNSLPGITPVTTLLYYKLIDRGSISTLTDAVIKGDEVLVSLLLTYPILSMMTPDQKSYLLVYLQMNKVNIMKLFLEAGWDINTVFYQENLLIGASRYGHYSEVKFLLEKGADPNIEVTGGLTPLKFAIIERQFDIAELLLKSGADPNLLGPARYTALMMAARNGQLDMVKLLLNHKADRTIRNVEGFTAEEIARYYGNYEVADYLKNLP